MQKDLIYLMRMILIKELEPEQVYKVGGMFFVVFKFDKYISKEIEPIQFDFGISSGLLELIRDNLTPDYKNEIQINNKFYVSVKKGKLKFEIQTN